MKSQYLFPYMEETMKELAAGRRPYAVGTFLAYRLRGKAKNWMGRYLRSLIKGLTGVGWHPTRSKLGGIAYKPTEA